MTCEKCGKSWPLEPVGSIRHVLRRPRYVMIFAILLVVVAIGFGWWIVIEDGFAVFRLNGAPQPPPLVWLVVFWIFGAVYFVTIHVRILQFDCSDPELRQTGKPETWVSKCPGCAESQRVGKWSR